MARTIWLVAAAAVLFAGSSDAAGASLDRSSATRFVAAATSFLEVAAKKEQALRAAAKTFVAGARESCPGALPADWRAGTAAQQRVYQALFNEAVLELELAELPPLRHAAHRYTSTLTRLRWTNRSLTRTIAISARDSTYLLHVKAPRVCAD